MHQYYFSYSRHRFALLRIFRVLTKRLRYFGTADLELPKDFRGCVRVSVGYSSESQSTFNTFTSLEAKAGTGIVEGAIISGRGESSLEFDGENRQCLSQYEFDSSYNTEKSPDGFKQCILSKEWKNTLALYTKSDFDNRAGEILFSLRNSSNGMTFSNLGRFLRPSVKNQHVASFVPKCGDFWSPFCSLYTVARVRIFSPSGAINKSHLDSISFETATPIYIDDGAIKIENAELVYEFSTRVADSLNEFRGHPEYSYLSSITETTKFERSTGTELRDNDSEKLSRKVRTEIFFQPCQ